MTNRTTITTETAGKLAEGLEGVAAAREVEKLTAAQAGALAIRALQERDAETLWSLTAAHRARTKGRKVANTDEAYRIAIAKFLEWIEEDETRSRWTLHRLTRKQAQRYPSDLAEAGASISTVRVRLAAVRALWAALAYWAPNQFLVDARDAEGERVRIALDPWAGITPQGRSEVPRHGYPTADRDRLVSAADLETRTLVSLCGDTGLRLAAALSLEWDRVEFGERTRITVTAKGGKTRTVHAFGPYLADLHALRGEPESGRIFRFGQQSARERLRRLCRDAGVKYRGFHALRHTAATEITSKLGQRAAMEQLGHRQITTTDRYVADVELDNVGDFFAQRSPAQAETRA